MAFSGGTKSLHETPTDRPAWPLRPKKVFEGSKGRFFKNAPWQGVGQSPTKRRTSQPLGHAFSGGTRSFHETPTRLSGFAFTNLKKFLRVPRGVFSKTLLGREWDGVPQKERASQLSGVRLFRRDKVLSRNTHKIVRLRLYAPKKVFEGSKGRFFKNAPLAGCGTGSHKRRASPSGHAFSGGTESYKERASLTDKRGKKPESG